MGSTATLTAETGTVRANGTLLYREIRGEGPPVLFISGMTGDAGHFADTAEHLAREFTVITYDRRGNSRSPAPEGWIATSMDEQADDAAALLGALGIRRAVVFGTSGGGVVLSNMILRHPEVLQGAIVHEPPILSVVPGAGELLEGLQGQVEAGLAAVGPRGTMEGFIRENAGDAVLEALDPELRERMLGNAEVGLGMELEAFVAYVPDAEALARSRVPIRVLAGRENRDAYYLPASVWLARAAGVSLEEIDGTHVPYFDRPEIFAAQLRPIIRALWSQKEG